MSLLIGVASYRSPDKLTRTLETIRDTTTGDWRCVVIHNETGDAESEQACDVARRFSSEDSRFLFVSQPNSGYCGSVNRLLAWADNEGVEFVCHCDNDIEIRTHGWNEQMEGQLRSNPECGWVFPGEGHYPFHNGRYRECLWHAGYCWMLSMKARAVMEKREEAMFLPSYIWAGYMNRNLGHHEEVEYMTRLRLAGFTTACLPHVDVFHHENSTQSEASAKRIHAGVVRWMNFSNKYFSGDGLKYPNPDPDSGEGYDPRTLRFTDWNVNALYLERMTLALFPDWNSNPRTVNVPGVGEMDAVEILKPKGCYVGRAI